MNTRSDAARLNSRIKQRLHQRSEAEYWKDQRAKAALVQRQLASYWNGDSTWAQVQKLIWETWPTLKPRKERRK